MSYSQLRRAMDHLMLKASKLYKKIHVINDPTIKKDLYKLLSNIESMISALSREAVECRRLNYLSRANNATPKFLQLSKEIDESFHKLERYITLYSLL